MPIFEYRCPACDAEFEQLVRASDEPACPWCESKTLERKLSASAVARAGRATDTAAASTLPMAKGGGCCGGGCGCH